MAVKPTADRTAPARGRVPRNVWAKVYCDLLRHPLFRMRPDSDLRLVLGLILHAKEHAQDGLLRGLNADEMRGLFGIKAPVKQVQAGLDYLLSMGWLAVAGDGLLIRDFAERQRRARDTPEDHAERQRRYRAGLKSDVTTTTAGDVTVTSQVTSREMSLSDAEEEEEEEEEEEIKSKRSSLAATKAPRRASAPASLLAPSSPFKIIRDKLLARPLIADKPSPEPEPEPTPEEKVGREALTRLEAAVGLKPGSLMKKAYADNRGEQ